MNEVKQVIVMRKDLNMRKGKMIAQGAHASLGAILSLMHNSGVSFSGPQEKFHFNKSLDIAVGSPLEKWINEKFTKICVYVNSEEELMNVYNQAKKEKMICSLITDAGNTEFAGVPTKTCCAIGPEFSEKIDKITGSLPLL